MTGQNLPIRRGFVAALLLAASAVTAPGPAGASTVADPAPALEDLRWLPWLGCWEGVSEDGGPDASFLVCFELLPDQQGVEIVTWSEGAVAARESLRADGTPVAISEGGCAGEQSARWSSDGRRVFLQSVLECGADVRRETRGVLAILPEGRGWAEIHAVHSGSESPIVAMRTFTPAARVDLAASGIVDPAAGRELAASTARTQAGRSLPIEAVVEIVEHAGAPVAGALVAERGEPFALDANTLRSMAARGVPAEVLDVMVAVTWPERFTITGGLSDLRAEAQSPPPPTPRATAARGVAPWPASTRGYAFRGYAPWGWGYRHDLFYMDVFYRSGGAYRWDRWGQPFYGGPSVIVIERPRVEPRTSVLSRNQGAVPSGGGSSGPSAVPASNASPRPATTRSTPPPSTPSSAPAATGGGGSGGSSGGNADEVRRAVPRSGG